MTDAEVDDRKKSLPPVPFYEGYIAAASGVGLLYNPYSVGNMHGAPLHAYDPHRQEQWNRGHQARSHDIMFGPITKPAEARAV